MAHRFETVLQKSIKSLLINLESFFEKANVQAAKEQFDQTGQVDKLKQVATRLAKDRSEGFVVMYEANMILQHA